MTAWRKRVTSPRLWFHVHGWLALVWFALAFPTMLWWRDSVAWVNFMTVYGLVMLHLTGFVAILGARKQDPDDPL